MFRVCCSRCIVIVVECFLMFDWFLGSCMVWVVVWLLFSRMVKYIVFIGFFGVFLFGFVILVIVVVVLVLKFCSVLLLLFG